MKGKSKREVERELSGSSTVKVTFEVSPELHEKLKELRGLLAHSCKTPEEMLERLVELGLKEFSPAREPKRSVTPPVESRSKTVVRSRFIAASTRREVWRRAGGKCSFTDPRTGRICGSRHALQVDHVEPYAEGGVNDSSNLQLLCRQHNLYRAMAG